MPEVQPAFPYATLTQQHEAAQLGMWTFLATEVLFFGGLILAYCVYRYGYPEDFAAAGRHTKIVIGVLNTAILLTSSFLVAWAVASAKLGLGGVAASLLLLAALLGILFLGFKGYEYHEEYQEHLVPAVNFAFDPAHARGACCFSWSILLRPACTRSMSQSESSCCWRLRRGRGRLRIPRATMRRSPSQGSIGILSMSSGSSFLP
jgi:cytochrome c oxidase subunit 3